MTLRHYHIFLAVCTHGGMTRAAEHLHISQPSVSQAIREMEEHYDTKLFERLGKTLFLTAAGQRLQHYARHMAELEKQTEFSMRGFSEAGPLRIGATLSIGESVFIPLLARCHERVPEQKIFSRIENTASLEKALMKDELDLALVEGQIRSEYLVERSFMEDEMILVENTDHPSKGAWTEADLRDQVFFVREEGSGSRRLFEYVMYAHDIPFQIGGVYNNSQSIKKAVIAGLGYTVLSRRVLQEELDSGRLREVPIEDLSFRRTFRLVYHRNKYLSPSMKNFIQLLFEMSGEES